MVALLSFTDIIYRWNILKYLFNCLTICSGQWVAGRTICRPVVTCVSSQAASQPVPSLFKNRLHSWPVLVAWSSRCSTCTCRGRVTGASEQQRAAGTGAAASWAQNFHLRRACFRQTATTTTYLPITPPTPPPRLISFRKCVTRFNSISVPPSCSSGLAGCLLFSERGPLLPTAMAWDFSHRSRRSCTTSASRSCSATPHVDPFTWRKGRSWNKRSNVTRLGDIWVFLGQIFLKKEFQMYVDFLGCFEKIHFHFKTSVNILWATFWNFWASLCFSVWSHWSEGKKQDRSDAASST